MSNTQNVKLGVCNVYLDGVDLGYTQGGVSVEVSTDTHPVMVDQFGESEINEYIMKRSVKVSVPMAETTLENLVRIMPGASLTESGGAYATGTFTFTLNPDDGETVSVNGSVFTFKTTPTLANDVLIGASQAETLTSLASALNASNLASLSEVSFSENGTVLMITHDLKTLEGNSFAISASDATASGATLLGGVSSQKRVDVTNGIGTDLLKTAKVLTLHPKGNAANDVTEDFTVFRAATAGALNFAYKTDEERIFNVEFTGYPDNANGDKLFAVGDLTA